MILVNVFSFEIKFLNTSKKQYMFAVILLALYLYQPPLDAPRPFSTGHVKPSSGSHEQTFHHFLKTVQQEAAPRAAAQPDTTAYEDKRAAATLAAKLAEEQQAAPGGARGDDRGSARGGGRERRDAR